MKDWLFKILMMIVAFTADLHTMFYAVITLLAFDFAFGIAASWKKGEAITSHRMWNTFSKMALYCLGILLSHVVELWLAPEIPWVRIITYFIAITEMYSVYESLTTLSGRDFFSFLKEQLSSIKKPIQHAQHQNPLNPPRTPDEL
jgi:phage-related holin